MWLVDHVISQCFNTFHESRSLCLQKRYRRRPRRDGNHQQSIRIVKTTTSHLHIFVFSDFFPPWKTPSSPIKSTLAMKVKVWTPPVGRPLRVACLHGTCSNGHITKASENAQTNWVKFWKGILAEDVFLYVLLGKKCRYVWYYYVWGMRATSKRPGCNMIVE